jgi:hypothetical protein
MRSSSRFMAWSRLRAVNTPTSSRPSRSASRVAPSRIVTGCLIQRGAVQSHSASLPSRCPRTVALPGQSGCRLSGPGSGSRGARATAVGVATLGEGSVARTLGRSGGEGCRPLVVDIAGIEIGVSTAARCGPARVHQGQRKVRALFPVASRSHGQLGNS